MRYARGEAVAICRVVCQAGDLFLVAAAAAAARRNGMQSLADFLSEMALFISISLSLSPSLALSIRLDSAVGGDGFIPFFLQLVKQFVFTILGQGGMSSSSSRR